MIGKRVFAVLGLSAGLALAQTGLEGGTDGLHQQSAKTLGQWVFSAGLGAELTTDNDALAHGSSGYSIYTTNGQTVAQDRITPMVAGNVHLALGLTDFWDFGTVLPLNYDGTSPKVPGQHMRGAGVGDLQVWTKLRVPFDTANVFQIAGKAQVYAPTGKHNTGMRPRHVWYVNSWGGTDAFTADDWALEGSLILTADLNHIGLPLRWNGNAGFVGTFEEGANSLIWGTGVNYTQFSAADFFLEFSGETRVEKTNNPREPLADPMRLTPGVRFHLPAGFDFALGADIGINAFRKTEDENSVTVVRIRNGVRTTYEEVGSASYGVSALLNWSSKNFKNDADNDGVADDKDQCAHTPANANVDSTGCPSDEDLDGIPDYKDQCKATEKGVLVDSIGCPKDGDGDGVADGKDRCSDTQKGMKIDSTGCPVDADNDGVADVKDLCLNTAKGTSVDTTGCPIDSDKDGVIDAFDKCPSTQKNVSVDSTGCVLDRDGDGVADSKDKCPNTPKGVTVDSTGCALDHDRDGVSDSKDKCPNTPRNTEVDSTGCVFDRDGDGVDDVFDKCPGTLQGVKVKPDGCPIDKKQDLNQLRKGIQFKNNSAKLTTASYGTLDDIVTLLRQIPSANLEVQGHTDNNGTEDYNKDLSQKRAEAVVNYFVGKGIESSRLRAIGYGTERPIADNKTNAGRKANRRVELVPFE